MILEITSDQVAQLSDADLRTLVGILCERELWTRGHSPAAVTWGGNQDAPDGGIDVRVALPAGSHIDGYVPRPATGYQTKAQKLAKARIAAEMAPEEVVRPSIIELAAAGGAYVIASSKESLSDIALKARRAAMAKAVEGVPHVQQLTLDFYDSRRLASWTNQHPSLVPWVRERLALPLSGWRPFQDWSSSPTSLDSPYLLDSGVRLVGPSIHDAAGVDASKAIAELRSILAQPKGVVRLVGLSGVGKTRLIQALFDARIGAHPLAWSDALYADISDDLSPSPQEMLTRLINGVHRAVLIIDNCGAELHAKLSAQIANSNCLVSAITVEYDINDDEPANSSTFRLEPASPDLVEKILELRYPTISQPSRTVIARFSEGNARVAFALAETAKDGTSLARLRDTELFERLFFQQKTPDSELLDAAKACALLYSFDGETLGDSSELATLARLVGQSTDQLYKHVAELQRRRLVQKRGKWRAILPHALANRLAKRALEDIPLTRLEEAIVNSARPRMLRSLARRVGYLHDEEVAIALSMKWLSDGGMLSGLGRLSGVAPDVFENVAPVSPAATLSFIEMAAAAKVEWFYTDNNRNRAELLRVVRSIAYEPQYFERCAALLVRFALADEAKSGDRGVDYLKSLFTLYLSGTHASVEDRVKVVHALFEGDKSKQTLGLALFTEMLRAHHFTSHFSFEFGARKRDFGFYPTSGHDVRHWYDRVIALGATFAHPSKEASERVRRVLAEHIREQLRVGMHGEVIAMIERVSSGCGGWTDAWIALRRAMKRKYEGLSETMRAHLEALEIRLRPSNLGEMIRAYALTPDWTPIDIADALEEEEQESGLASLKARERVFEVCVDLGRQLARQPEALAEHLPEILQAQSTKPFHLGRGIAAECPSFNDTWALLRAGLSQLPNDVGKGDLLAGFLSGVKEQSPAEAEALLDHTFEDVALHPNLPWWQAVIGLELGGLDRMLRAVALDTVPITSFGVIATGRSHQGLSDDELRRLLDAISSKQAGVDVAAEVLGMRVFGVVSDKLPISTQLRETCREFLRRLDLNNNVSRNHLLGQMIRVAFGDGTHEDQAREFCNRILAAVEAWKVHASDIGDIVTALAKVFPLVVLDILVEAAAREEGEGRLIFVDMRQNRECALDHVPEETWVQWAAQRPETRHELLAHVIRFSNAGDDEPANGWSPAALRLIEVAHDPDKVLDAFLRRFHPRGWTGSLADALATRSLLIEELKLHRNPAVVAWANQAARLFAAQVAQQRRSEAEEHRVRNQSFE